MRVVLPVLLLLLQVAVPFAQAAFYQWTDAQGVVHFTDDPDKIPPKYQKKARRLNIPDQPAPAPKEPPAPQASPQVSPPKEVIPDGKGEEWWRERYAKFRGELKTLEDGLAQKQTELVQLKRKRTIYVRARDREAVNVMQAEISADEARIAELLNQLAALELEATREGVPAEWRR